MVNKTISISWELDQKLKKEENSSALISRLLNTHFGDNRSEEQIIEDVKVKEKENAKKEEFKKRNDEASAKLRAEIEEDLKKYTKDGFQIV